MPSIFSRVAAVALMTINLSAAQPYGALLWYNFNDECTAKTIQDHSGFNNHGLLKSDANAPPSPTGSSLVLDANKKQYVAISNFNEAWGKLGDWSVSVCVNLGKPVATYQRLFDFSAKPRTTRIDNNDNLAPADGYVAAWPESQPNGAFAIKTEVAPGAKRADFRSCWAKPNYPAIHAGNWTSLTWTYEKPSSTMRMYADGKLVSLCVESITKAPCDLKPPTDMWLGKSGWAWDQYGKFELKEFAVYGRVLSDWEAKAPCPPSEGDDVAP